MSMITWLENGRKYLGLAHPPTGRMIAENGEAVNIAEFIRSLPISIARGQSPGSRPDGAYGEQTSIGNVTNIPVWPNGDIKLAPPGGEQLYAKSTGANAAEDAVGGSGIQYLSIHLLDADRIEREVTIEMDGSNPVPLPLDDSLFVQCTHTAGDNTQGGYAAGKITIENGAAEVYSEISIGFPRCSSAFRMVPKGKVLYIDGAVGSSLSVTAAAESLLRLVSNEIYNHHFDYPLIWVPFASVGVVNDAIPFNFPPPGPFREGAIVGATHSSNKDATISVSWFGRLETAPDA